MRSGFAPIIILVAVATVLLAAGGGVYYFVSATPDTTTPIASSTPSTFGSAATALPPLTVVGVIPADATPRAATTVPFVATSTRAVALAGASANDCKANIDCLIKAAVACRPAVAVTTSRSSLFSIATTAKVSHLIKGVVAGKCEYQFTVADMQYASADTSIAGEQALAQARQYGDAAIGTTTSCKLSAKDLVKRLNDLKKGIGSGATLSSGCTSDAPEQQPVAILFARSGGEIESTVGAKKVSVTYKSATETMATLIVRVNAQQKLLTLELRKEVVFGGVGFTITSLESSPIFANERQVGIQLVERN